MISTVSTLQTIAARASEAGLDFLLAGGHAVISHGHKRATFDLDLIVCRSDRGEWLGLAKSLDYHLCREGPTFAQFSPPSSESLPLDLMLVNEQTFPQLLAEAVPASPALKGVKVVSVRHLLALKCHAIKHGHKGRIVKGADDVINLVQVNRLDLNTPEIRQLFLKHGTPELKKSNASALRSKTAELEFPDWSGMEPSPNPLSVDRAFELCEQYARWFPQVHRKRRYQRREKCVVEFTL